MHAQLCPFAHGSAVCGAPAALWQVAESGAGTRFGVCQVSIGVLTAVCPAAVEVPGAVGEVAVRVLGCCSVSRYSGGCIRGVGSLRNRRSGCGTALWVLRAFWRVVTCGSSAVAGFVPFLGCCSSHHRGCRVGVLACGGGDDGEECGHDAEWCDVWPPPAAFCCTRVWLSAGGVRCCVLFVHRCSRGRCATAFGTGLSRRFDRAAVCWPVWKLTERFLDHSPACACWLV